MRVGVVRKWVTDRGYGFIQPEGGSGDLFVHVSALNGLSELAMGQRVEFEEQFDAVRGKSKAVTVRVLT
jgi:cold shock protein